MAKRFLSQTINHSSVNLLGFFSQLSVNKDNPKISQSRAVFWQFMAIFAKMTYQFIGVVFGSSVVALIGVVAVVAVARVVTVVVEIYAVVK